MTTRKPSELSDKYLHEIHLELSKEIDRRKNNNLIYNIFNEFKNTKGLTTKNIEYITNIIRKFII